MVRIQANIEGKLKFTPDLDDLEARATDTVKRIDVQLKATEVAVTRTEFNSYKVFRTIMSSGHFLISVFSDALGPVKTAMMNATLAMVESLYAISTAMYSNPWTALFGAATTIAATALEINGAINIEKNMALSNRELAQANHILQSVMGTWG